MKNVVEKQAFTIVYGGWYQRTTLHLSEIYDFLALGISTLPLDQTMLKKNRAKLQLSQVTRETGELEYVRAQTKSGIEIRYYEDGLYILELVSEDVVGAQTILQEYFDHSLNPAIGYIFSLGAPTPKVLANIKTTHPIVCATTDRLPATYEINEKKFGRVYQKLDIDNVSVFKTETHIFIITAPESSESTRELIELQIFFREFKDQLGKYLSIHRSLWENIARLKERKQLKAGEAAAIRGELDRYQVTVDLITSRMNQMGSYVKTRASISRRLHLDAHLTTLFQYKFEVLLDTLEYIKELWSMTVAYLRTAIDVVVDIQNQGTKVSIQSLTAITTFGVLANIIVFMTRTQDILKFNAWSFVAVCSLAICAFAIDRIFRWISKNKNYKLKFSERSEKI